jgi:hypothetical protein
MAKSTFDAQTTFKAKIQSKWDSLISGGGTGDNIPVTKSKYKIYFNDLDGSYLMIPNQP